MSPNAGIVLFHARVVAIFYLAVGLEALEVLLLRCLGDRDCITLPRRIYNPTVAITAPDATDTTLAVVDDPHIRDGQLAAHRHVSTNPVPQGTGSTSYAALFNVPPAHNLTTATHTGYEPTVWSPPSV